MRNALRTRAGISTLALVASLVAIPATPAAAATVDASAFASQCGVGMIEVTGTMRVVGGTGQLTAPCVVKIVDGGTLLFRDVVLTSAPDCAGDVTTGCYLVTAAGERTVIRVTGSVIDLDGAIQLSSGCCAGDALVPEDGARTTVVNSTLEGWTVEVSASFAADGGTTVVRGSRLVGTDSVRVSSSNTGMQGTVRVANSTLESGTYTLIDTGTRGATVVSRSLFFRTGSVTITTGAGGRCRSTGNTPATACS